MHPDFPKPLARHPQVALEVLAFYDSIPKMLILGNSSNEIMDVSQPEAFPGQNATKTSPVNQVAPVVKILAAKLECLHANR